jgi:hypothetical protein
MQLGKQRIGNLQSVPWRKRRSSKSQIDRSKSKLTLAELCDIYLKTVHHQKPKTVERKTLVVQRTAMAVGDSIIAHSPATNLKKVKLDKPIRRTPTFEQFQAIVEGIRSQKFNGHDAGESADFVEFIGFAGLGREL